ncbi:tetraspanin-15-like isoform 2-T2 [Anomaloglossus baeobatrachus]|uniref:tetraspanin-15-like isoform X2 n=1 Tax=Anomaloglossus baeobatrachus TaxID=238106 RepID=UPI003F4FEAFB
MAGTDTWRATLRTYYCIKFSLSFYSTLFSLIGLLILCIGIYAESERRKHQTLEGIFLAPAIILLLLGMLMFVVSFIGMVGSLRDNLLLLKIFFWVLLVIFLVEVLLIVIELVCENEMKKFAHANILAGLKHYYDDLDFKNIMDFVQEKFSCCGGDQFTDWMVNPYHSCNSTGPLSCGVPYTCCITGTNVGGVKNTLCGYQTLNKEALGIALSYVFWRKLKHICAFDEIDFRFLKMKDFNFKELDLSGAGCCLCLPREGGYLPVNMDSDDEKPS